MPLYIRIFTWSSQSLLNALEHFILPRILNREPVLGFPKVFITVSEFREEVRSHVCCLKINLVLIIDGFLDSFCHITRLIPHNGTLFDAMISLSKEIFAWHLIIFI
jgi:hypothetical protein